MAGRIAAEVEDDRGGGGGIEMRNNEIPRFLRSRQELGHAAGLVEADHGNAMRCRVDRDVGQGIKARRQETGIRPLVDAFQIGGLAEKHEVVAEVRTLDLLLAIGVIDRVEWVVLADPGEDDPARGRLGVKRAAAAMKNSTPLRMLMVPIPTTRKASSGMARSFRVASPAIAGSPGAASGSWQTPCGRIR